MGMDAVELIMMAEEEFAIEIPDADAELLATPGDLCALVERKLGLLQAEKESRCPTSRAFYAVRRELMSMGIERSHITPRTPLEPLWPRSVRRHNWNALSQSLGVALPDLGLSYLWVFLGLVPLVATPFMFYISTISGLSFCILYSLLLKAASDALRPFAIHTPQDARTVADLSHLLAPRFYEPKGTTQNIEIWPRVQRLVAEICEVPIDKVQRDSLFFRDLGMS